MVTATQRTWALFLAVSCLSSPVFAEPKARCPEGQRPSLSGCVEGGARAKVRARADADARVAGPKPVPKPDPALTVARAKPKPLELASKTLLVRELARLEAILKTTPEDSPDRPILLRRLAEGYAELERVAESERAKSQAAADAEERAARELEKTRKPKKRGAGTVL
ncbi:MAG TPA: hypothetical protein VFZ53_18490 [Polyangiaceae bacterium]